MLDRLKDFFESLSDLPEEPRRFSDSDHRVAAAGLLVHVLNADGTISPEERSTLEAALMTRFSLRRGEVRRLIEAAQQREAEEIDFQAFTVVLKRSYSIEDRRQLVRLMWDMALADGVIHPFEDDAIFRVAALLDLSEEEALDLRDHATKTHETMLSSQLE